MSTDRSQSMSRSRTARVVVTLVAILLMTFVFAAFGPARPPMHRADGARAGASDPAPNATSIRDWQ